MQILLSDRGNHSPEKWAIATASMIFNVEDARFVGDKLLEAKRKEIELIELLADHHKWHQDDEKGKLNKDASHILSPVEAEAKLITSGVVELMHGSSWQDHFSNPEVQDAIEQIIKSHTETNRYTERSWHADQNEYRCPFAKAFKGHK